MNILMSLSIIYEHLFKGILLGIVYFQMVDKNSINIENILFFTALYMYMVFGAMCTGIDAVVITSAFMTKTIFTLMDEKIKKKCRINDDF